MSSQKFKLVGLANPCQLVRQSYISMSRQTHEGRLPSLMLPGALWPLSRMPQPS